MRRAFIKPDKLPRDHVVQYKLIRTNWRKVNLDVAAYKTTLPVRVMPVSWCHVRLMMWYVSWFNTNRNWCCWYVYLRFSVCHWVHTPLLEWGVQQVSKQVMTKNWMIYCTSTQKNFLLKYTVTYFKEITNSNRGIWIKIL